MKGISPSSYQRFTLIVAFLFAVIFTAWKLYEYSQISSVDDFEFVYPKLNLSPEITRQEDQKGHITFVTAYYNVPNKYNKSKDNVYIDWITNFIGFANQVPLIVFSTGKDLKNLRVIAKHAKNIRFVDLPMDQFQTHAYRSQLEQQKQIDPEKDIHTLELYMIWNEKPYFIKRAMDLNIFNSTHYCWVDIGMVRDSRLSSVMLNFPQSSSLKYFYNIDKVCFSVIEPKNLSNFKSTDSFGISIINKTQHKTVCISGGFFFGRKENLLVFIERYYKLFDTYIHQGVFAGKEQNLMANIISNHIEDFIVFDAHKIKTWLNRFQKNIWFSSINMFSGLETNLHAHTPILTGGLGNQLFQVASIYGVSRKRNQLLVLDPKNSEKNPHSNRSQDYFNTIFKRFLQKEDSLFSVFVRFFSEFNMSKYRERDSHFHDLKLTSSTSNYSNYSGFFQNYKYFDSYLDELLQLFDLPQLPETRRFFIHIRLGDYVNNKDHYVDLKKYYQTCLEIIRGQYGENVEFCVFTNDKPSAEKYLLTYLPMVQNYTFGDSNELFALAEMRQCALGGICANSTFSWWGAMLNPRKNKKIFFPNRNYPETSRYRNYDIKGLFHPDFMIIETD